MEITVTNWSWTAPPGAIYSSAYPDTFEIQDNSLTELSPATVKKIARLVANAWKKDAYAHVFSCSARIPYDNLVVIGTKAAFILLEETHVVGGMSWKEAVYLLKREEGKIEGKAWTIGNGASYSSFATHYRYTLEEHGGKIFLVTKTRKGSSQGPTSEYKSEIS